jgi:hypothetical protein
LIDSRPVCAPGEIDDSTHAAEAFERNAVAGRGGRQYLDAMDVKLR